MRHLMQQVDSQNLLEGIIPVPLSLAVGVFFSCKLLSDSPEKPFSASGQNVIVSVPAPVRAPGKPQVRAHCHDSCRGGYRNGCWSVRLAQRAGCPRTRTGGLSTY